MLSNQTSRVYCDIEDLNYLADMLADAADGHEPGMAWACAGAALAVDILAHNRLQYAADFMAVFTSRLTETRQTSGAWGAEITD